MSKVSFPVIQTDILILGAGGAGLCAALHAADSGKKIKILIVTKAIIGKGGCSRMVQGGYNVVLNPADSFEKHFQDTLKGGQFINNQDLAWTLVTLLVLPILVIEQVGLKEAFTRSATAFKRTWGENVVGNGGIGLVVMLIMLAGLLVTSPVLILGISASNVPVIVAGVALMVIVVIVVSVFGAAMNGVFRTALYRYAVLGEEPPGFTHDQIAGAFRPKKGSVASGAVA